MQEIFFIVAVCGLFFGPSEGPAWNSLRTTWGTNLISGKFFQSQPFTIDEAKEAGFEQIPGQCNGESITYSIFSLERKIYCRKISRLPFY